jgi:uncharacterized protein (DUF362 family)
MKRRDFIKKTGQAIALAAVAGEVGLLADGCQSKPAGKTAVAKPNFEVANDPQLPKIVLAKNVDHALALSMALGAIGGIGRFVKKGERVLLKPNLAWDRTPQQAVNTSPIIVGEMVRQCKIAGASYVIVTDIGSRDPQRVFARSGVRAAVEQNGGRMVIVGADDYLEDDFKGKFIGKWPVLKHIFEVDRLINMPIAKHHTLVLGSAGMKNFFGAIGGERDLLHDQIEQAIVDLAAYFRPTLTVIDATRVLMRNGPGGGSLDDVEVFDSVICATDQVAADSRANEFLGSKGSEIGYIVLAAEQGLGEMDYQLAGFKEIA